MATQSGKPSGRLRAILLGLLLFWPVSLYARSLAPSILSDIRFPGDRRNCVKCQVPGTNEPPPSRHF